MSTYRVLNRWPYRGHRPGDVFDATLEPDVERRAVDHRVIEILIDRRTTIAETDFSPPSNWTKHTWLT